MERMRRELQVGIVLVGTKSDLEHTSRSVSAEEIYALAAELQLSYFELSARCWPQVHDAVEELVRQCRRVNVDECVCGAADAKRRGRRHAACRCHDVCAECHKRRIGHAEAHTGAHKDPLLESHPFVAANGLAPLAPQTVCCAIQ